MFTRNWLLLLVVLLIESIWKGAAKKEEAPLLYQQQRVNFLDPKGPSKKSTTRWEPMSHSRNSGNPSEISTSRRACGFYWWNVASASMYHLCRYLMKDAVFEGKGGRKFVRIEPNSLLELLYPVSRHSPDKCVFCGGSFADHLTLRWSKHIFSPYDLYMDRTYEEGVLQKVKVASDSQTNGRSTSRVSDSDEPTMRYAFHTRYVHDLGLLLQGMSRPRDKIRKLKETMSEDPYLSDPADMKKRGDTIYVVPSIVPKKKSIVYPLLRLARQRVLEAVEALIDLEQTDNNELFQKQSST